MSGVKGWPTSQKLSEVKSQNEFVTVQPQGVGRFALDTFARFAFRVGSNTIPRTAGAGTANPTDTKLGFFVADTATPAMVGDFIRFETGNAQFLEVPIVHVETNGFRLGIRFDGDLAPKLPASGDDFYIMRLVTQQVADDGTPIITANSGPIQFVLDGVDTEVEEDTVTPANSIPLPVKVLNSLGNNYDEGPGVATLNTLRAVKASNQYANSTRLDYSVTNVTTGAWVELLASVGANDIQGLTLFDGGGYAMELGIGGAGSEARLLLIPPGGFNGVIPLNIPATSRLSIRAVGAALVNAGEIDINLLR
jgi:hypothetical protein